MSDRLQDESIESIAIIGMSGCFPGARELRQFWHNLCAGVESITQFSEEEHAQPAWADSDAQYVRAKGVVEDVEWFDAAFFGYSPEEAVAMDPQHRLFLERGWEALENAGYCAETYSGSIGVFAGVSANTYLLTSMFANPKAGRGWLTDKDFVTTRLSYKLNLRGPSVAVQTACSTSLVAVCQACQSLLNYQCDMAVAGGATVWVPTKSGYPYLLGGPASPNGHCRAFDVGASGFVPGSGAGAVLLKRLSEALADGDSIAAVIKGSALNNDGSAKVGYTAPSIDGQAEVVALALGVAGIDPATISYVEAHGTGTELGDPIEVAALTQAFRTGTAKKGYCAISSVKPNIGHLDAAAGIAGLIKAVLCLQHRQLPPTLHFERPNPKIDFANSPFFVNTRLTDWNPPSMPRRAGVSSFGIGGTNAHVILEEAPVASPSGPSKRWQLLPLSAKNEAALKESTGNLAQHLERHPEINLADVAYTLQAGRQRFAHRRIVVCEDVRSACAALRANAERGCVGVGDDGARRVVFLFPGQGSQHPQMARELYEQEPVFRDTVDRCCQMLHPELGLDLREVIYPDTSDERTAARLTQTALAQPAIFVIEYALAELWRSRGVEPAACLGHSIGEYVAACLASVFDLKDALRLIATRARLMDQMQPGAMLAIRLAEDEVRRFLADGVCLAAVNGPSLSVLSGPIDQIDLLQKRCQEDGIEAIRLHTSHAFHSSMMDPMLMEFERFAAGIRLHEPQLPYLSNVTGGWIEKSQPTDPAYWSRHVRQPVRFLNSLEALLADDYAMLEVGPGRTLTGLVSSHPRCETSRTLAASLGQPQQGRGDLECLLQAAGQLWMGGVAIDWQKFHGANGRRRIPLPTYPFQRQRYWSCDEQDVSSPGPVQPAKKKGPDELFYVPSWKRVPAPTRPFPAATSSGTPQRWLILRDEGDLGTCLAARLTDAGCPCIKVTTGPAFRRIDSENYEIHPISKADWLALLQHLSERGESPTVIAHLLAVTCGRPMAEASATGRTGFYSLLYLAQALASVGMQSQVRIGVVTDGAQMVCGDEQIDPAKSLVQGPCRVIPQELPSATCRQIDIAAAPASKFSSAEIDLLIAEITGDSPEPIVALRHGYRWLQSFEPLVLDTPERMAPQRLRKNGVYLITGGLGGVGLALAEWLAREFSARLVLTARTALPERSQWPSWLSQHAESDATCRKIRCLQSLEKSGAEVLVLAADVGNASQMQMVVHSAKERFGAIHGVIHAAGIAGGGMLQLKTSEVAERVLAPKVEGLLVLEQALTGQPLDFVVLCSSISALAGGIGQVDYCAANAFLDAMAWKCRAAGGPPTISVNWNAWRDAGMAVETELPAALRELRKQVAQADSLSNAEGADALRRILTGCYEPQVAVTRTNLPELLRQQRAHSVADLALPAARSTAAQARPDLKTAFVEPASETERSTADIWRSLFGFDRIGAQDDFFELGGHSLMALQLLERVRAKFGVNLALAVLFELKTVENLARHIDAALWAARPATATSGNLADQREEITL